MCFTKHSLSLSLAAKLVSAIAAGNRERPPALDAHVCVMGDGVKVVSSAALKSERPYRREVELYIVGGDRYTLEI